MLATRALGRAFVMPAHNLGREGPRPSDPSRTLFCAQRGMVRRQSLALG
jgi:hypothetical protein